MGQQVVGSVPTSTGGEPSRHRTWSIGQATGVAGSHFGVAGTHWPVQVSPVQLPVVESHLHVGSVLGHAQATAPALLAAQPQPVQDISHFWPEGQSVSALQPLVTLGTQTP